MGFNRTSMKQAITVAAASTGLCAIVFSFLSWRKNTSVNNID